MHVDPARVDHRDRGALVVRHREQPVGPLAPPWPALSRAPWIADASYSVRPSATAVTVVTEPARPTSVARLGERNHLAARAIAASTSATSAVDLVARRRVGREVPLGQPHAADVDAARRDRLGRCRARTRSSRRRCRRRGTAAPRPASPRVAPANDSRPPRRRSRPRARRRCRASTPATNSSRFAASRDAEVATNRTPLGAERRAASRRSASHDGEGARERLGREPPGAVDALAEPHDLHLAVQVDERARLGVDVGDEQADRVGAAVDRGDPGRCVMRAPRACTGPAGAPVGEQRRAPRRRTG